MASSSTMLLVQLENACTMGSLIVLHLNVQVRNSEKMNSLSYWMSVWYKSHLLPTPLPSTFYWKVLQGCFSGQQFSFFSSFMTYIIWKSFYKVSLIGHNSSIYMYCRPVRVVVYYYNECHLNLVSLCLVELNECDLWTPCKNGATCHDLTNDYTCTCAPGWTDKNCSTSKFKLHCCHNKVSRGHPFSCFMCFPNWIILIGSWPTHLHISKTS